MSGGGTIDSRFVDNLLMVLWEAGENRARGGISLQTILRQTLAPLPHVQEALDHLQGRGCQIERTPTEISLGAVGINAWRHLFLDLARRGDGTPWRIGRQVFVLPETASTNDVALAFIGAQDADGTIVLTDVQTAGRGRLGRTWLAKAGQSVLMSVLLIGLDPQAVERLTLLAGLAVAEALEEAVSAAGAIVPRIEIKWPNDLWVHGKKIGGILVERRVSDGIAGTVVGLGINVSQGVHDFPPELAARATSLFLASGRMIDRARVIAALLKRLNKRIGTEIERDGSVRADYAIPEDEWIAQWKQRCPLLGRRVTVRSGTREITGDVLDISPLQGMVIRDGAGSTHWFTSQGSTLAN